MSTLSIIRATLGQHVVNVNVRAALKKRTHLLEEYFVMNSMTKVVRK